MQEAANDALPPGARLAAERERQNLSRADIAQRLHMSAYQVQALEEGDYARLPRGTFLRGFVRNYAKVLGLPGEPLLAQVAEAGPRDQRPGIVVDSQNIRFDSERLASPYVKAGGVAVTAIVLAFAGFYWLFNIRPSPPASAARKVETAVPAPAANTTSPAPQVQEAPPLPPPTSAPTEPVLPAPAVEPPKAEPPKAELPKAAPSKPEPAKAEPVKATAATGEKVLRLKFKGNSWVEVRDGRGRILHSQVNRGGSVAEVAGRGPFAIVVGNAPDVQLAVDDRPVDLEPHTRVAVARLTVP